MPDAPAAPAGHVYTPEIDRERVGWYEITGLLRRLEPDETLGHGYYRDPDWSARDLVAHLGTWLAEAETQFQRMGAGTYDGHDAIDIEALNAWLLTAMADQPWTVVWVQAQAARTRMLVEWFRLPERTPEADWWIRKAASDHYAEHLDRLREWVAELVAARHTHT
jgi:hypothetical protein